jgi:methylated-DNA-[protein]-cysteine S-methyltransferase
MTLRYTTTDSPLGSILLAAAEQGLCGLYFHDQRYRPSTEARAQWLADAAPFTAIRRALDRYFSGDFAALRHATHFRFGTPFQHAVWQALQDIPPGQTITYAQLAARLGRPAAVRAVGAAVGRNPLSLIIPCHRVIGSTGALTGYAGGLERKRWLLAHEGVS